MSRYSIVVICLIITLILGVVLIGPRYKELKELQQEIKKKSQELEYQEKYLSDLEEASQNLKEYTQELQKINSALPPSPNLPALFGYFQKASSQNGLVLKSINPAAITTSEKISGREIKISLSVVGSYPSFKNFLATLQKSARLIGVTSLAFSLPPKGEIFDFSVNVKMHSY